MKTLSELSQALAAGKTTSLELTTSCLNKIADENGEGSRAFINVYVDGLPADLSTATPTDCTVHVLPAVAGG